MESPSLLDMPNRDYVHWYVVYMPRTYDFWWNRHLKEGFEHVQLWRPVQFGPGLSDRFWLVVDPGLEHIETTISHSPIAPWDRGLDVSVQSVRATVRLKKIREYFFWGPITCVEVAKMHLGIASWFIRTPWQLYKHIRDNNYNFVR